MERGAGLYALLNRNCCATRGNLARGCQLSVRDCDGKGDGIWDGERGF